MPRVRSEAKNKKDRAEASEQTSGVEARNRSAATRGRVN
jgi:hypothetical protein